MTDSSSDPPSTTEGSSFGERSAASTRSGLIFVCDASAEAGRLMTALRSQGYPVVDVPIGLLPTRVRYETPELILIDADAPETARRIGEMREAGATDVRLVLLGQTDGTLNRDPSLRESAALVFTRPLDIESATHSLCELLGPAPRVETRHTPRHTGRAPILVASARRPYRTDVAPTDAHPAKLDTFESHWPITIPPGLGPIFQEPIFTSGSTSTPPRPSQSSTPPGEGGSGLSPETRTLLEQAKRRVAAHPVQLSRPSRLGDDSAQPIELSRELLEALTEPLGLADLPEEEASESDTFSGASSRGATRASLAAPLPPSTQTTSASDRTNPGGKFGSRGPEEMPPSSDAKTVPPPSPHRSLLPLDDLSDLLTQPVQTVHMAQTRIPRVTPPSPAPQLALEPRPFPPSDFPPPPSQATVAPPATLSVKALPEPERPAPREFDASTQVPWQSKDAIGAVATAIRQRLTGTLAQQTVDGIRRIFFRDGDLLTLGSSSETESLVHFLEHRGDLTSDTVTTLGVIPKFGRHAGAALIARGHLRQEDLWPVLRAHAEWLFGLILSSDQHLILEENTPARLLEEPAVFGGAAGAEIFVDVLRRVLEPQAAFARLGAGELRLGWSAHPELLGESALPPEYERAIPDALEQPLARIREKNPALLVILTALTELDVLSSGSSPKPAPPAPDFEEQSAEIDDEAFAALVRARRALVDDGDYFTILGVARSATKYEVDRALEVLRREFDDRRLTGRTAHMKKDLELVLALVEEAHLVLSDDVRRERYRRALEATPL